MFLPPGRVAVILVRGLRLVVPAKPFSRCPSVLPSGALAENNRLGMSTDVIDAFETLMTAHRGEVTCKITSAEVRNHHAGMGCDTRPSLEFVLGSSFWIRCLAR